jgi:hypothetical protein
LNLSPCSIEVTAIHSCDTTLELIDDRNECARSALLALVSRMLNSNSSARSTSIASLDAISIPFPASGMVVLVDGENFAVHRRSAHAAHAGDGVSSALYSLGLERVGESPGWMHQEWIHAPVARPRDIPGEPSSNRRGN